MDKTTFIAEVIKLTQKIGKEHGQNLSDEDAFAIIQDIVSSNYPKCAVKYITGQDWML